MKTGDNAAILILEKLIVMKKLYFGITGFLLLALMMASSSCEDDYYTVNGVNGFNRFYTTRYEFESGMWDGYLTSWELSRTGDYHLLFSGPISLEDHLKSLTQIYYDGRDKDGNSTWSDPLLKIDGISASASGVRSGFIDYNFNVNVTAIGLNTPPVHLHLCLRTWDEGDSWSMERTGRTWKVSTIVDDQGKDLTKDPEWNYYTDNTMRFEKADRFIFTPGQLRSAKEIELFGTAKDHTTIIGSYSIAKKTTGEVQLTLVFPNFNTTLTVLESRFGYIKLSGVSDGKKGILELAPID